MQVLVQCVGGVDGVEFLGGVFTGVFEDDLLAAGVFFVIFSPCIENCDASSLGEDTWQKLRNIIRLPMNNHPARLFRVMLDHVRTSEFGHFLLSLVNCQSSIVDCSIALVPIHADGSGQLI